MQAIEENDHVEVMIKDGGKCSHEHDIQNLAVPDKTLDMDSSTRSLLRYDLLVLIGRA